MAKEGIAFNKMHSLCQLQDRHGNDLGQMYQMAMPLRISKTIYIAQALREQLGNCIKKMDGSTDRSTLMQMAMMGVSMFHIFVYVSLNPYVQQVCTIVSRLP